MCGVNRPSGQLGAYIFKTCCIIQVFEERKKKVALSKLDLVFEFMV